MTEYYERTLEVKQEVLGHPAILELMVKDYEAMYEGEGKKEAWKRKFAQGNTRAIFRVGQLASGLWLAHKVWWARDTNETTLESECRAAEKYFNEGKRVPYFHMAVMRKGRNGMGSILTEDVTNGGKRKVFPDKESMEFVWVKIPDGRRVRVYVDFKWRSRMPDEFRYSSEEVALVI